MSYEWNVDHETCTICVRGHGRAVAGDTLSLIRRMGDTLASCDGYDVLYDGLELQAEATPPDILNVAEALFGSGVRFRRFAIVVPPARVPLGRIFAALSDPHGVVANVFDDVETALEWLSARPHQRRYPRSPVQPPRPSAPGNEPTVRPAESPARPVEPESPEP